MVPGSRTVLSAAMTIVYQGTQNRRLFARTVEVA